jgi:GrpB-like predicted nucleotidyltransferase (UPF0157 family)
MYRIVGDEGEEGKTVNRLVDWSIRRLTAEKTAEMTEQTTPVEREPTSEERLREVTVGEIKPLTGPIPIADYDPAWPQLYAREEARIRRILGDRVRRIEHTGSTSVPGLAAKPIIDISLAVPDSSDEPSYVLPLEAAGYVLRIREPDWFEHRLFKGPDTDINLHVFTQGCE